jgi:hypothetical protein
MRSAVVIAALLAAVTRAAADPTPAALHFREQRVPSGGQTPFGVAVADLDRDGRLDLAVTNAGSDALAVLLATADGGFRPAGTLPPPARFRSASRRAASPPPISMATPCRTSPSPPSPAIASSSCAATAMAAARRIRMSPAWRRSTSPCTT